jgi:hypothetical protein
VLNSHVGTQSFPRLCVAFSVGALLTGMGMLCAPTPVAAQGEKPEEVEKGPDDQAHPLGGPGLKLDLGYRRLFGLSESSVYYRLNLLGKTLTEKGKEFKNSQGFTDSVTNITFRDDSPQLSFLIERGIQKTSGPLAKYLQLGKLPRIHGLRAVVQGYGTLDDTSSLGIAAGIETVPLPIWRAPNWPNFTTVGVQFGTQPIPDPNDDTRKVHRDVGVIAYRQFIAHAPLDKYSNFRQNIRDFAATLAPETTTTLPDFYAKILEGDVEVIKKLAAKKGKEEAHKRALAKLKDSDFEIVLRDLKFAAPAAIGAMTDTVPPEVAKNLRTALNNPPAGDTQEALRALKGEFQRAVNALAPVLRRPYENWENDDKKTLLVAQFFVMNGGLVLKNTNFDDAKKYVAETLKLQDPDLNQTVNDIIDQAAKQELPSQRKIYLTIANRALLEAIFPELKEYGLQSNISRRLLTLYSLKDRPSSTFLIENTGQYYFSGDAGNGSDSRLNHLFAATFQYYLDPGAERRNFFRLRYENGRDRADPGPYVNQITFSVGIEL